MKHHLSVQAIDNMFLFLNRVDMKGNEAEAMVEAKYQLNATKQDLIKVLNAEQLLKDNPPPVEPPPEPSIPDPEPTIDEPLPGPRGVDKPTPGAKPAAGKPQ